MGRVGWCLLGTVGGTMMAITHTSSAPNPVGRRKVTALAAVVGLAVVVALVASCSVSPTPDQPTPHSTSSRSVATPAPTSATAETDSAHPLAEVDANVPFSPCMVSDDAMGAALGLEITVRYPSQVGNPGEYLCSYQTAEGTVLEIYVYPPVNHRVPGIGGFVMDQADREAPEERSIAVDGATDAHGYLAFPGIDVRFETEQAFIVLSSRSSSDQDGLDKTVAVANLVAEALALQGPP